MISNYLKKILFLAVLVIIIVIAYLAYSASFLYSEIKTDIDVIMKGEATLFYQFDNYIYQIENIVTDISVFIRENYITENPTQSQDFETFIDNTDKYLKAVMKNNNKFQGVWFIVNPELFKLRKGNNIILQNFSYTSWFYIGADGEIVKGPRDNQVLTQEDDPYFFETVKEGKMTITNVYTDTDNNKRMISITNPIYNDKTLVGVAGVDVNLDKLESVYKKITEQAKGLNIYLFDSNGEMIIGTKSPSKALYEYAKGLMNDKCDSIIKTALFHDSWVFIENQSSKSPYLAGEISLSDLNSHLKFLFYLLYISFTLLFIFLSSILILPNIRRPSAISYKYSDI